MNSAHDKFGCLPADSGSLLADVLAGFLLNGRVGRVRRLLPLRLQGLGVRCKRVDRAQGRVTTGHLVVWIGRRQIRGVDLVVPHGLLVGGRGGAAVLEFLEGGGVPRAGWSYVS